MVRRVSILLACVLGPGLGYTDTAFAQETGFRGWVSLIAEGRLGWLENENRLGELCREARDLDTCYQRRRKSTN